MNSGAPHPAPRAPVREEIRDAEGRRPGGLVGRDAALTRIEDEIHSGSRIVTILGPPGIGKTSVARAIQRRFDATQTFAGRTSFCDLSSSTTTRDLLFAVLSLFDDGHRRVHLGHEDAKSRVVEALRAAGPSLLVLDNFEQLTFAADAVQAWSAAAGELVILVTSRERLAVPGEVIVELAPLDCPKVAASSSIVLESDAVRLFCMRAHAAGGEPGTDAGTLGEIVRRLDGIPLAIELAAARTRVLSLSELLRRLDTGHDVLGGRRGVRHSTLTQAIDGSWNLLSATERDALAGCSVFAGSFAVDAAEDVVGASVDVLGALRDKSLLRRTDEGRLSLLVSIREYAAKKLNELGRGEEYRRRHVRHYAMTARRFNEARMLRADDPSVSVQGPLRRDAENLVQAAAFARGLAPSRETSQHERELALALASIHALPGEDCIEHLSSALEAVLAAGDPPADAGSVLLTRRGVWSALGRHDECLRDLERIRAMPAMPAVLRVLALVYRGVEERYYGDVMQSLATHDAAARELEGLDLPHAAAMNLVCRGRLHCDLGNEDDARKLNDGAFDTGEALGNTIVAGLALANLGQLEQDAGRFDRASDLLQRALDRLERVGEAHYVALYAGAYADLSFERGKLDEAHEWYERAARYLGALVADRQAGIMHASAAALEAARGDDATAMRYLEAARRCATRSRNPVLAQVLELHRGTVELFRSSPAERSGAVAQWTARLAACRTSELAKVSMDLRFAIRILERTLRTLSPASETAYLRVTKDASRFSIDNSRTISLGRRAALRRILDAMCVQHETRSARGLELDALLELGWPGERVLVEAGATRVRVAVATLRRLGLKTAIVTRDDGYLIDPRVRIERVNALSEDS